MELLYSLGLFSHLKRKAVTYFPFRTFAKSRGKYVPHSKLHSLSTHMISC